MKKIMFILFALMLSSQAFAQNGSTQTSTFRAGWTRNAYPGLGATQAGDSLHYIGRILMRDGYDALDSLTFHVTNADSLRYGVLVKVGGPAHTTDTIRVYVGDAGATTSHFVQKTAAGVSQVPWHAIVSATGGEAQSAQFVDLYLWVYRTGTEVASSGDTMNIFPKAYK